MLEGQILVPTPKQCGPSIILTNHGKCYICINIYISHIYIYTHTHLYIYNMYSDGWKRRAGAPPCQCYYIWDSAAKTRAGSEQGFSLRPLSGPQVADMRGKSVRPFRRQCHASRIRKLFTLTVDVGNPISMYISSSVSAKTKACSSIEKSIILLYNFILVIFYCSLFWNYGTNQLRLLPRILQHLQWLQKGLHAEHLSARRPLVAILGPQKRPNDIFRSQ